MTFLAPWALAIAGVSALGMVLLHLVAHQRPAAYLLPTTRFIPDRRTLVRRAAARPRDLVLLAIRVLLLLAAGAAFARPVLVPRRGAMARVILLDRSRAVANSADAVARVRARLGDGVPTRLVAFDSLPREVATTLLDSVARAPMTSARGSLSAALVAGVRSAVLMAERADSVQLVLVSPVARGELDAATLRIRAQWPGAIQLERVALHADSSATWTLETPLPSSDALGPALASPNAEKTAGTVRLLRHALVSADSAVARAGGTVVYWDSAAARRPIPDGVAAGDVVVVAALERRGVPDGHAIARWADGTPAAVESALGAGCVRDIGIALPAGGDLPLHAPFQRLVRTLIAPCGVGVADVPADSTMVARVAGSASHAASAAALRQDDSRPSPLARWLLGLALLLALGELLVRARLAPVPA